VIRMLRQAARDTLDAATWRRLSVALGLERGMEAVVFVGDPRAAAVVSRVVAKVEERARQRNEDQIASIVDLYLDQDPAAPVEARINEDNAAYRARLIAAVPSLTSAEVHAAAGRRGVNAAQTAAAWKRQGRLFAVPHGGRDLFPAFQFDADGQPRPLVREVLAALPAELTPWQRAGWFASRNALLDGATPAERIVAGDPGVVAAAAEAGQIQIG
jgi:hypothetical protein